MSGLPAIGELPRGAAWRWPLDLSRYDRAPGLTDSERKALEMVASDLDSGKRGYLHRALPRLRRLLEPIYAAFEVVGPGEHARRLARKAPLRDMECRQKTYWAWNKKEWSRIIAGETVGTDGFSEHEKTEARKPLRAVAYLLCGYDDLRSCGQFKALMFARSVFGEKRFEETYLRVRRGMEELGHGRYSVGEPLLTLLAHLLLANRSPLLEGLDAERLEEIRTCHLPTSSKHLLVSLSRVLVAEGILHEALPAAPPRTSAPKKRRDEGCPEEWASWCERWLKTSPLAASTKRGMYGNLLQAGRWLAHEHPDAVSPEEWRRKLAAEYVAFVDGLTIGKWVDTKSIPEKKLGRPVGPSTKAAKLAAMATFFRDLQEWGWVERRFDPRRALAVPKSVRARIEFAPRAIADEVWAKLLWAGLNLNAEDVPARGSGSGGGRISYYPVEMVRAVAIVWLFSGLRMDEIRHLRVGCVRWQHETAVRGTAEILPEGSVCWLDVPANKTSEGYPKPVDPLVGKAIETWEEIRPRQPAVIDGRTSKEAHYLFSHLGKRLGYGYVNDSLIPTLCRKAGTPEEDARGRITSHRARSTIATQLVNAQDPMTLFELQQWLGHKHPSSTLYYAKITPTRLARSYRDAGYFGRNLRHIEVLVDGEAVRSGMAAQGEPWKFYDLGHGHCTYDFFQQCPHRMACARCSFYVPKDSTAAQLLEGKANLSKMREEIPLTGEETAAVEEGIGLHEKLLERLADVPTPSGPTPRQLGIVPLSAKPPPAEPSDST